MLLKWDIQCNYVRISPTDFNSGLTNGKTRKKKKKTFLFIPLAWEEKETVPMLWQLNRQTC